MTGITTTTQPKPDDQTLPPNGQAQEPVAPVEVLDADEIEYRQAVATAEAEEAAAKQPAGQDPPTGTAQAQPGEKTPKGDQQPGQARPDTPVIPKARLDEVAAQRDENARQAAYWQGVAEGRTAPKPAPGQEAPPPAAPTTEQRLAEVRTSIKALATQFDNGEITMADLEEKRAALFDQEHAIREEVLLAKFKPPATAAKDGSLLLDERTAELETAHPWVTVFDAVATPAEWGMVKALAVENLTAQGIDPTQGDRGSLALRAEVAKLMDQIGPGLLSARATAKGVVLPGQQQQPEPKPQQQQPPGGKRPLSTDAAARAAKLALQADAPPNLNTMTGHVGEADGGVSDATVEVMKDADWDALPQATRNRILGITSS